MDRDKKPLSQINGVFGVDASNFEALRTIFCRSASEQREELPSASHVLIPEEMYYECVKLYNLSIDLVEALFAVLDDGEHQHMMREAKDLGYDLPDLKTFRSELEAYGDFLESIDVYQGKAAAAPENYMEVRAEYIGLFYSLMNYNCLMISRVFSGCFETEYMEHFGNIKSLGFPYSGATALQETIDLLAGMYKAHKKSLDPQSVRFRNLDPKPD